MAVDYSEYARIHGGGSQGLNQGAAQIGAGIGAGFSRIPNVMDKLAASQGEGMDNAFAPLLGLLGKGVEEWGDIDKIPSAGEAYMGWVNSMSPRQKRMARRSGILNPVAYKQQYDAQMEMYLPAIKEKLEAYRTIGNKTDKSMREFLSTKPGLNQFFLANTSPEELALSPYFKPTRSWAQWAEGQGGAAGLAGTGAKAAIAGAGAAHLGMGFADRMGDPTGYGKKGLKRLHQIGKEAGFGKEAIEASKARRIKGMTNKQRVLTRAQNKYKTASKAYKGKRFSSTTQAKKLRTSIKTAEGALSKARSVTTQNVKGLLNKVIKKHGKMGVLKHLGKKMGKMGAVKLFAKLGLAAVPGAQVASGALLATDLIWLASELKSLAE
jgi:hypothetical protein